MQNIKIPDELSVIPVSVQEQRVLEEYVVPLLGDEEYLPVFYKREEVDEMLSVTIDESWDMRVFEEDTNDKDFR